jgi:parvulin-like peptidyl-prolyl isomerase
MKKIIRFTYGAGIIAALLSLAATACKNQNKTPAQQGPVIAQVNNESLTKSELDSLRPEGFEFDEGNLPKVLDKWVSNTLMYQEAVRRGILKEPQVQQHLKRLERDYLVNELLDRLTTTVKVDPAKVLDYYNQHKDEFDYEVKIQRIVLPDSMMAVQTLADFRAGGDFTKLAQERSQDALLEKGQESRYFSRGVGDPRMGGDPKLEEVIFSMTPGQVSDVVPSQEGYQIVKLIDKKKVKQATSLAEAKDYIGAILSYRQSQALVDSVLTSLRAKAKIELRPDEYFKEPGRK